MAIHYTFKMDSLWLVIFGFKGFGVPPEKPYIRHEVARIYDACCYTVFCNIIGTYQREYHIINKLKIYEYNGFYDFVF